jgi:protein ImuB
VVVVMQDGGALRLSATNAKAAGLGLAAGMTLADARARIPDIVVHQDEAEEDRAFLSRIAEWCERYTPLVMEEPPDGLIMEIAGSTHLFGGEEALLGDAAARLSRLGLAVRGAVASTPDCARAVARFGKGGMVLPGQEGTVAAGLPVAALESDAETHLALRRAGLKTLGDLAARPRKAFAARFGGALVVRLAGILGEAERPLSPRRPLPDFTCETRFADPIGLFEDIEAALGTLSESLCRLLEKSGQGGRAFEAVFFRADGVTRRIRALSGRPLHHAQALKTLMIARLDALADPLDPGFGFDAIRLSALRSDLLSPDQQTFERGDVDEAALAELVDRLTARFGAGSVERFEPLDSHVPERAVLRRPAIATGRKTETTWDVPAKGEPPLRPLLLFTPPQPVETVAEVPDGPPLRFRWRRVLHEIVRMEGPERIAPEWWRDGGETLSRDYYRVEDVQGHRFWLFRHGIYGREVGRATWYIHGLFS